MNFTEAVRKSFSMSAARTQQKRLRMWAIQTKPEKYLTGYSSES